MIFAPPLLIAATNPPGATPATGHIVALLLLCLGGLLVVILQQARLGRRLAVLEQRLPATPVVVAPPPAPPAVPAPAPAHRETGELVAAIAAACHVALGARVRIVAISNADDFKQVWSLEGRRQIFASHQVR